MSGPLPGSPPRVTIVTPSFNQGEFIADTIESVLLQDYPAIEYLVMDGGSTDATLDVLRSYGDRVAWRSQPDAGQPDAIAKGFEAGTGELLAWINSDDRYLPGAITALVAEMEAHPEVGLVYGNGQFVDRGGSVVGPAPVEPWDLKALIDRNNYVFQPATLFRRSVYEKAGGLDRALHYVMDYDLWIRLGQVAPVRHVDQVVAQARVYPQVKSYTGGLRRLDELTTMIRSRGGRGLPSAFRREMWLALRGEIVAALRQRRFDRAIGLTILALPYGARAASWRVRRLLGRG